MRRMRTDLVTANLVSDVIKRMDDVKADFFALFVFGDSDIFDVPHAAEIVDAG